MDGFQYVIHLLCEIYGFVIRWLYDRLWYQTSATLMGPSFPLHVQTEHGTPGLVHSRFPSCAGLLVGL
jgi:hypothetical protein